MPSALGVPHGAGSNHANAGPPDIPIEPLRRRTADEHRAAMEEKAAKLRRFADGSKAAASATYEASIEPRADEPPPEPDDVVVEPTSPPARPARPVPAPPRSPVRVPSAREQQTLAMVTAYVDGDTSSEIAARFGVSSRTVLTRLRAAGVQIRPRGGHFPAKAPRTPAAEHAAAAEAVPPEPSPVTPEPAPVPAEPVDVPPSPGRPRGGAARIEPDELARMVADYEAGKSAPEIADATGRTAKNVRTALQRAGVRMRDDRALRSGGQNRAVDDPELVERVRALYVDEGLTQAVVADRLDTTLKVVQGVMKRNAIEARPDATGVKREPAPAPARTVRYRDPDAAARPSTDADPFSHLETGDSLLVLVDGTAYTGTVQAAAASPAPAAVTFDVPPAPEPATPDLADALAAAVAIVTTLLDAVGDLGDAVERVQAARLAAAARATDAIRRDAQTLLAVLGEHPATEGTPS